jgi:uncharacterized protein
LLNEVIFLNIQWRDMRDSSAEVHLHDMVELPDVVKETGQIVAMGPVEADLRASRNNDTILVQGVLSADVTYRCSRCLQEYVDRLEVPFAEQFIKASQEMRDDEDERIATVGEEIDLDPWIEQAVVLALPYRPLCKQDCAGLCPVCGINRNESSCDCELGRIDPRLADLARFFEQQ